jgi:hypothetical protein
MADKWIKIERNTELHKGDIVELDFALISLFDWNLWFAMQLSAIEDRLEADTRFTLLSHTYPEENLVTFKVKIDQNPVAVSAIIAIILVASFGIWVTFEQGRKLVREFAISGEAIGWSTMQIAGAALVVILGLVLLRKAR